MWWLLLFLPVCGGAQIPDTFTLSVPDGPLSVQMGSSIILPCSLSPAFTASLKVRWYRPDKYKSPVLLYEKQQVQHQAADPQYRGRVSLVGELEKGNVSLKLDNVSPADHGEFVCFVAGDKWYEQASVHLIEKAMGSPPVLSVTDGGSGQVNVTCVSDGWSPQPTLTWRNNRGAEIPNQSHHNATDAHGRVTVSSWLLYSPSDSEWVECSVGLSAEERKESRILPHTSRTDTGPWKEVFITFLVLLLLSIAMALILHKKGFITCNASKKAATESQQVEFGASGGETENLLRKKEEVKTLQKEVKTLQKKAETLQKKNTDLQSQLDTSNREMKTLNPSMEVDGQNHQIKGEMETLNQQIKATDDERKKLEEQLNDIKKENQKLTQQNEDLKKQSEEMETLKKEVQTLKTREGTLKKERETMNQRITELQRQLDANKREVKTLHRQIKGDFLQSRGLVILWKTLTHFKDNLTMDEASVKGDLEVHTGLKIVKCTKLNKEETLNATATYVLCKETFSSGQHFWEVDVTKKKSWCVGVCSDALRRQDDVSLTPQNGCWLLCYNIDQGLTINTDPEITSVQEKKKMKSRLEKLGVFLDCCRHSLTFYDGKSESCLCTICDVGPTLQLVPVFSPGVRDQHDLKIMD